MTSRSLQTPRETAIASLMAFAAGSTDTVGFIALFSLFTAHVTGNFVLLGATLAEGRPGVLVKLLALPTFILVVAATRFFERWKQRRGDEPVRDILFLEMLFLVAFLGFGLLASPIRSPDAALPLLAGLAGVTAMAIQNAASRTVFASLSPTTVMTGNVTQLTLDIVDLVAGHAPDMREATIARFRKMWPPVLWFAGGAAVSGICYSRLGFWCLAAPFTAILVIQLIWRPCPSAADSETH